MSSEEIDQLRSEIAALKKQVAHQGACIDDLYKGFKIEGDGNVEAIAAIYQSIGKMYDYLYAVYYKVFPEAKAAHQQIADFMKQHGGPAYHPKDVKR